MDSITVLEDLFHNFDSIKCDPTQVNKLVLEKLNTAVEHTDDPTVQFRASSIGRPWITQVLDKWYGSSRSFNLGSAQVMYEGRVAQAWAEVALDLNPKLSYLTEGRVTHSVIAGHYDLFITLPSNERVVLEVKSMGGHLLSNFKKNPHDDFGYLSQLSFYAHTLQADSAAFLVRDRTNAKWHVVRATPHALSTAWERLSRVVEQVKNIPLYDVDVMLDLFYNVGIPHPVGGKVTNNMRYSKWFDTLYQLTVDGYVIRPQSDISLLLRQIPAQRQDSVQLSLEYSYAPATT